MKRRYLYTLLVSSGCRRGEVLDSKRHSLQAMELSRWLQTAVQWGPDLPFWGQVGHADGWLIIKAGDVPR